MRLYLPPTSCVEARDPCLAPRLNKLLGFSFPEIWLNVIGFLRESTYTLLDQLLFHFP
jgi:hypothetical protein